MIAESSLATAFTFNCLYAEKTILVSPKKSIKAKKKKKALIHQVLCRQVKEL